MSRCMQGAARHTNVNLRLGPGILPLRCLFGAHRQGNKTRNNGHRHANITAVGRGSAGRGSAPPTEPPLLVTHGRRTYHRLARDWRLAFCVVCLPISLDEARARNAARSGVERVADATLIHMSEVLQWPEPESNSWEASALTLAPGSMIESFPWDRFAALVAEPVAPAPQERDSAARAQAAAATAASVAHTLDLKLRRATSLHLQSEASKALPAAKRGELARTLGEQKKHLLSQAKSMLTGDTSHELADILADELDAAFTAIFARASTRNAAS